MPREAPPITDSEAGRIVVSMMADSIGAYMERNGIPCTDEGFDDVVRRSVESGQFGMIGFEKTGSMERLRQLFRESTGTNIGVADDQPFHGQSIRSRLSNAGMVADERGVLPEGAIALVERLVAMFGEQARTFILPFMLGDCQRRLVFDELRRRRAVPLS